MLKLFSFVSEGGTGGGLVVIKGSSDKMKEEMETDSNLPGLHAQAGQGNHC